MILSKTLVALIGLSVFTAYGAIASDTKAPSAKSNEDKLNHVYQVVPGDDFIQIILSNGKKVYISFSKDGDSLSKEYFRALKYSIYISSRKMDSEDSPLYLIGSLEGKIPAKIAGKNDSGSSERFDFKLQGWFIKTPYIGYPQVSGGERQIPVKRTTLEAKDFKAPIDGKIIRFDQVKKIYWIGVDPSANGVSPNKPSL